MILLCILIGIGIIISKEFRAGIGTTIGAIIAFTPIIILGFIHFLIFLFYRPIKEKHPKLFLHLLWRFVHGIFVTLGDILKYGFAYKYDELANIIGGEMLEDLIGTEEETPLGKDRTTISASLGYYEYSGIFMNKWGTTLSKTLNRVFSQKYHALGSWKMKLELKKLDDKNLYGNTKKR